MVNEKQCRAARAWLGISQNELADISGVSPRTIAHFESGRRVPHDRTLRDLREAFERSGFEFLFEDGVGVGVRYRKPKAG
jgi:transcriptional regulator with XRE-family HTH domain